MDVFVIELRAGEPRSLHDLGLLLGRLGARVERPSEDLLRVELESLSEDELQADFGFFLLAWAMRRPGAAPEVVSFERRRTGVDDS